jgi:uncharacterized protein YbbC (DUF1343 family)
MHQIKTQMFLIDGVIVYLQDWQQSYALKYAPDRFQLLNELYERSFNFAASTDNDGVSLRIQPTALNLT